MKSIEFVISIVFTIGVAFVIALWVPGTPAEKLKLAFEYGMLILLFLFALLVLAAIASGKIDIGQLLSEHGGGASMARFQLLIFTFVIGLSFCLIVVCECKFPDVPNSVLALLGISATTYGVSKGIQAGSDSPPKGGAPDNTTTTGS
ncbi:MAG TPA: hypothetical protein VNW97_16455 [Candidatus Saccharimonadales bacterium]|jgi:hypothetical protein|nr:hypothetical protein [Candidatus Saccharimonadales bacterium]